MFLDIQQDLSHLILVSVASSATGSLISFNGDKGANYTYIRDKTDTVIFGNSVNSYTSSGISGVSMDGFNGSTSSEYLISNYAYTNVYKSVRGQMNLLGRAEGVHGVWNNVSAINRIEIQLNSGLFFNENSRFALYGVR